MRVVVKGCGRSRMSGVVERVDRSFIVVVTGLRFIFGMFFLKGRRPFLVAVKSVCVCVCVCLPSYREVRVNPGRPRRCGLV